MMLFDPIFRQEAKETSSHSHSIFEFIFFFICDASVAADKVLKTKLRFLSISYHNWKLSSSFQANPQNYSKHMETVAQYLC